MANLKLIDVLLKILKNKDNFKRVKFWNTDIKMITDELSDFDKNYPDSKEIALVIDIVDKCYEDGIRYLDYENNVTLKVIDIVKETYQNSDIDNLQIVLPGMKEPQDLKVFTKRNDHVISKIESIKIIRDKLNTLFAQNAILDSLCQEKN